MKKNVLVIIEVLVYFLRAKKKKKAVTHKSGNFNATIVQSLPHLLPVSRPAAVNLCTIQHPCCPVRVIPHRSTGKSSAPRLQAQPGCLPHKFTTHTLFVMHCSTQGMRKVCGVSEVNQIPPHI